MTRAHRFLVLTFLILVLAAAPAGGQVLETFPVAGSVQTGTCGPFGVRMGSVTLSNPAAAITVRGTATGRRQVGEWHVSSAGDTVLFTPAVPFAPGEEVIITVGEGHDRSWRTLIRPKEEHRLSSPDLFAKTTISLAPFFSADGWIHQDWAWADLNGDHDQEGVLLLESAGLNYLVTVAYDQSQGRWEVRSPASCTIDNPLTLAAVDLGGRSSLDLALLSFSELKVWMDPGSVTSPLESQAQTYPFPAGFNARNFTRGDLDNDGDEDLVVFGLFGHEYLTLLNEGESGLVAQPMRTVETIPAGGDKALPWPVHTLLRDADGDGLLDLIWAADYQEQGVYRTRLAPGHGDGTFGTSGILNEAPVFPGSLAFGRLLDPWDDSPTGPMITATFPDNENPKICGFTFGGNWPAAEEGCLPLWELGTEPSEGIVSHSLAGDGYPEIWWVEKETGLLQAVTLDGAATRQTLALERPAVDLSLGDFDFDGDVDAVLPQPEQNALVLLTTPGGIPFQPPTTDGVECGGTVDFGVREVKCLEAAQPLQIPFTNPGLFPARIIAVQVDDPRGVFSLENHTDTWFGEGCLGSTSAAVLSLNYSPIDTVRSTALVTTTMEWAGAAHDGSDTTVTCALTLEGRGGIHRVEDPGHGIGSLLWNPRLEYYAEGGALDFGILPALAQVSVAQEVTLTNTGNFAVQITPPPEFPAPFALSPEGPRTLAPGQTETWTVHVNPTSDLVAGRDDGLDIDAMALWSVETLMPASCLLPQTLPQNLRVHLLPADPRLVPDRECSGVAAVSAGTDTLALAEDGAFTYCLGVVGWDWPGAAPEMRVIENPFPWVTLEMAADNIAIGSEVIGPEGGDILIEVRDTAYATVFKTFRLNLQVEPTRPDLRIVDLVFVPTEEGGEIQQQYPFYADVVVEVTREPVSGAEIQLEGGPCTCPVEPLGKVSIDLVEGRRDTVRFQIESCVEAGECPFTACIEPPGGLEADFDPSDNCFTIGTAVAANSAPGILISNLVMTPEDPELIPCDDSQTWNVLAGGLVQALGVREENTLAFDVQSVDPDGDDTELLVGILPQFVHATAYGDTMVSFSITPPVGLVTQEICQDFGPLTFQVIETGTASPETTLVELPLYVKWEGPDLVATLDNVPVSAGLSEDVRFNGRVRCQDYDAGPFTVELWVEDPAGRVVASRRDSYEQLSSGLSLNLPQVMFPVEMAGEFCAHVSIVEGRDLNPDNNSEEGCFLVASGPFMVSPDVVTPNGDGHNDAVVFRFQNQIMPNPTVRIFDLTGHLVHETSSLDGDRSLVWDGRDQDGNVMAPGTYLWVVYDDGREFRTGTCGVIR